MKSRVALLYCDTYESDKVYEKLKKGFEILGGSENIFFKDDKKLFLKLNLVRGAEPERAVTTHPVVAAQTARILSEAGFNDLEAGDSPGFGSPVKIMTDIGLEPEFKKYGVVMNECREGVRVDFEDGIHAKSFALSKEVARADAIVSICKMKTHALEYITGAVKNQYGCVHGLNKAKGHTVYSSQESFAKMLVDLNKCVNPRLYIMDGIVAMEGNGPTSGEPVNMNVLLMSTDPVALDAVFCDMIGLEPKNIPTEYYGKEMGLGTYLEEEIEVISEDGELSFKEIFEKFGKPDFDVIRTTHTARGVMGWVAKLARFKRKPKINEELCRKCGVCVEVCPAPGKAISFANGRKNPPVYNYRKCIRCFCCQEMCPHKAIYVKGRK